jgi:eukaryotic-like serine/threonine-protein kinase
VNADNATQDLFYATLQVEGEALRRAALETVRPSASSTDDLVGHISGPALVVGGALGVGGMGLVLEGAQPQLGRAVAVKTMRPDKRSPSSRRALLHEARIAGRLDHPNVVPVHDLRFDSEGDPQIVLKKIEGQDWSELHQDAAAVAERFGRHDLLEWNVRTLISVCNAVHYAHSSGVLHRDIKPGNVRVGRFGEVYLMDWGLGVELGEEGTWVVPTRRGSFQLAGTPGFMAPEMAGQHGGSLDARTDVYLLAATLYAVLTGAPPHSSDTREGLIRSIIHSQPRLPTTVPAELADLCRRALSGDPAHRPPTAESFRAALEEFLDHRSATQLAQASAGRLEELRTAAAAGCDGRALHRLYNECRFGFAQALASWPEAPGAAEGLAEAVALMVEHELGRDQPAAAAAILADAREPSAALVERVEAALATAAEARDRDARILRRHDPSVGQRTRWFVGMLLGLSWTVIALASSRVEPSYARSIQSSLAVASVTAGLGFWARESLFATAFNRKMFSTVALVPFVQLVWIAGAWQMGIDKLAATQSLLCLWFVIATMSTFTIDGRLAPGALGYLAGFAAIATVPAWSTEAFALSNIVMLVNIAVIWIPSPGQYPLTRTERVLNRVLAFCGLTERPDDG